MMHLFNVHMFDKYDKDSTIKSQFHTFQVLEGAINSVLHDVPIPSPGRGVRFWEGPKLSLFFVLHVFCPFWSKIQRGPNMRYPLYKE